MPEDNQEMNVTNQTAEEVVTNPSVEKPATKHKVTKQPTKTKTKDLSDARIAAITAKKQAYIYLGPNIPGGTLFTGSVYKEKPEHLKGLFENIPEIEALFIEIKDAPAFKRELERNGSEASRMYQNAGVLIKEGRKGANGKHGRI